MAGPYRISVERAIFRARMSEETGSAPQLYPSLLVVRVDPVPTTAFVLDLRRLPRIPDHIFLHNLPNGPWTESIWYGSITQRELNRALEAIVEEL
ncbi:ORF0 [Fowl aviadenovirus E]|uniref:ORF0 n=4 Tax=Fowl aviadenovirus E TaxID=190065 RepID=A0A1B2TSI2_9ADEN|nr:ORF0 [Fowl aviadenovirus 7]ANJ02510.1 ORF0 [Fowl adenovirus 8a]ANJ02547.1 ORF0 [Fowl adenovirus 8b]AOC84053.1 ORF0 [Fowl aviadenovirus E]QGQ62504.1 ORF0 [Fowl aviadenovirus E]